MLHCLVPTIFRCSRVNECDQSSVYSLQTNSHHINSFTNCHTHRHFYNATVNCRLLKTCLYSHSSKSQQLLTECHCTICAGTFSWASLYTIAFNFMTNHMTSRIVFSVCCAFGPPAIKTIQTETASLLTNTLITFHLLLSSFIFFVIHLHHPSFSFPLQLYFTHTSSSPSVHTSTTSPSLILLSALLYPVH